MKGSTRDRTTIEQKDREMIQNGKQQEVIEKYRKKVLKDNDFTDLKMQFKLSKKDANNLIQNISLDADFLKGYNLTDYSLFVTIHKYSDEEANKAFKNHRINRSADQSVIYNFSIIDFLCVRKKIYKPNKLINLLHFYFLFNLFIAYLLV